MFASITSSSDGSAENDEYIHKSNSGKLLYRFIKTISCIILNGQAFKQARLFTLLVTYLFPIGIRMC